MFDFKNAVTLKTGLGVRRGHLFKRAYIWLLPPRAIEEWTYLLTKMSPFDRAHIWLPIDVL